MTVHKIEGSFLFGIHYTSWLKASILQTKNYLILSQRKHKSMETKYCLALDLKDDPELIKEYEYYHTKDGIWPEIMASIRESGIDVLQIFRTGNRLFMILEAGPNFSFENKERLDNENPKVQEWEELMWRFQQALPWAKEGEKWVLMDKIFDLQEVDDPKP